MLGRALLPLARPATLAPARRAAVSVPQKRLYAKERKPKTKLDSKLPTSTPASQRQASEFKDPATEHPRGQRSTRSTEDYAEAQSEVETAKKPVEHISSIIEEPSFESGGQEKDQTSDITPEADALEQELSSGDKHPHQPLPDLTQGIPSTLEAELQQARSQGDQSPASLDTTKDSTESVPSDGARGGDGLPKNAYISSNERKKNALIKYTYLAMAGAFVGWTIYLGRNWESEEEEKKHLDAPSGWGPVLFYSRAKARMFSTLNYYNEPAFPKLLPDEEADPNLRAPFTLVLSLEDLLVHQEWTRETGWRIAKRPGVDYFIRYLSQYYELVLFTSQPSFIGDSVLRKLDPYRIIRWPLFREGTLYKNGEYIKDLSYLNRDLSKLILIDTVPSHAKHQPENAIILPKWKGDPADQTLVQLIPFLEYVATMGFDDTRQVLHSFEGTYIPAEFAQREKLLREKFAAKLAEERQKKPKRSMMGGVGSILGVNRSQSAAGSLDGIDPAALNEGEMLWDQIRKRGQKQYEMIDKQIREEGQKWLDDMAAEEKKLQEESMTSMKGSVLGFFGGLGGGGGSSASG